MKLKKVLLSSLVVALAVSMASCSGEDECEHLDKDDNFVCDICEEDFDDGLEKNSCTFNVVDNEGNKLAGAKFTLTRGSVTETLTVNSSGTASIELIAGKYSVEFDYDTIPSGFLPSVFSVEIKMGANSFDLVVVDNNPNGSEERPYMISENVTELTIGAGAEIFYGCRVAANRKLSISEGITVVYNGNSYTGEVELISEGVDHIAYFSIKNTSASALNAKLEMIFPLGSADNPIVVTNDSTVANVPGGGAIYYKWTASEDGVFVVTSENVKNNILLTNRTTNAVSSQTDGSLGEYMVVHSGDEVIISVSAKTATGDAAQFNEIIFNSAFYKGTESDPIPVFKETVDISIGANETLVFEWDGIGDIELDDEDVTLETGDGFFTVTNTLDTVNGVVIDISK